MSWIETYVVLFIIIFAIAQIFNKSVIPSSLLLVIVGMIVSFVPHFPQVNLNPEVVLDIFLPMLVYEISAYSSWQDLRKNIRPVALLSVGHVLFITILIAVVIHKLIPSLSWPLAFVLGAVISPPDTVAIVSIAEKIHMPKRIVTILEGEGMLNDATALILFRFALAAAIMHQFSLAHAISSFIVVIIGETAYGLILGFLIAEIRLRIRNPMLHVIASLLTPFLAYLPAVKLGGSGVLATVVVGFVIGHIYAPRFTPEFRLISRAVWPALAFSIQSILFLLVGLDMRFILQNISSIPLSSLFIYSAAIIATVIVGRFIWVYGGISVVRFLFPSIRKKEPYPPWQATFIVGWSGMRGSISLAAALAVPILPAMIDGANARDLLIFLVFCVIAATLLLQGLTLPWLLRVLGVKRFGDREKYCEHIDELKARKKMLRVALRWLSEYKEQIKDNERLLHEVKLRIKEYRMLRSQLKEIIANHNDIDHHDEVAESTHAAFVLAQIIEVERAELLRLWHEEEISTSIRNTLQERLDHRSKHL